MGRGNDELDLEHFEEEMLAEARHAVQNLATKLDPDISVAVTLSKNVASKEGLSQRYMSDLIIESSIQGKVQHMNAIPVVHFGTRVATKANLSRAIEEFISEVIHW